MKEYERGLWVTGDGRFQSFIQCLVSTVEAKLAIVPRYRWTGSRLLCDVFTSCELLRNCGLLMRFTPVGGPEADGAWIGKRIDRRLSTFGRRYYEGYVKETHHSAIVWEAVSERWKVSKKATNEALELERQLERVGLNDERREELYRSLRAVRDKITKDLRFVTLATRTG